MSPQRVPLGRVALVWLALAAFLLVRSISQIAERRFPDPDDILRLVQVRDLLAGQGWFDLHQYRIDGPAGTLMHWSRIVDVPLALGISLLSPLLGADLAEHIVVIAIPLVTLGAILLAVAKAASYHLDREGVTLACLCAGLAPLLLIQIQPLRIDHHGWQILTVMLGLIGLAQPLRRRGAMLTGLAMAAGLSISLEVLPIAAGFGLVFTRRWLSPGDAGRSLASFLVALAGGLAVLFVATRGLADLVPHCDVISPAHLALFAILAAGTGALALKRPGSRVAIVLALGMTGLVALGVYLSLAPQCAGGPFGNLDPLVREFWYENVAEGRPTWRVPASMWIPIVAQGVFATAALAYLSARSTGDARRWWLEYLLIMSVALVAGLLTWRSMAFVGALSAIPLGWLTARALRALHEADSIWRKAAVALVLLFVLVPSFPVAVSQAAAGIKGDETEALGSSLTESCSLDDAPSQLNRLEPAMIFAPFDVGSLLLLETHHQVVATPHHRGQDNIRDTISAFLGTPDKAREILSKHGARYLLICSAAGEVALYKKEAPQGFAAMLARGDAPNWLQPVDLGAPRAIQIWRVTRDPQ